MMSILCLKKYCNRILYVKKYCYRVYCRPVNTDTGFRTNRNNVTRFHFQWNVVMDSDPVGITLHDYVLC